MDGLWWAGAKWSWIVYQRACSEEACDWEKASRKKEVLRPMMGAGVVGISGTRRAAALGAARGANRSSAHTERLATD
jgi:hypothetical protein